ncbi:MAG TPA: hypothetical protein VGF95_12680 [Solirubrobacteraceae bacterium]
MIDVICAAALTCASALVIGQAVCWLCGARRWTFLAAPVGFALLMLICAPTIHVPGRTGTVAVILLVLFLAGAVLLVRKPALRPRLGDLLLAAPVLVLVLLPFLASGRGGTLGIQVDNDMATHLIWAEAIRSAVAASVESLNSNYPVGPHGLAAVLATALGARVDYAFAGESMAIPVLIAWTTVSATRRSTWLGKAFVATLTSITFMVASYYAEGSFKEPMLALLLVGFVIGLPRLVPGERGQPLRWIPLAIIVGGALSVYSVDGLPWFVAITALWLVLAGAMQWLRGIPLRNFIATLRDGIIPGLVALAVLIILIAPQLGRILRFAKAGLSEGAGTGIAASTLGNLIGPVSFWKVFGMWDVTDFRLPAAEPFHVGMLVAFGLLLTIGGGLWSLRRRELVIPIAVAVGTAIWIYSNARQSPYVAAKALVVLAPLVMLLATRWLVELDVRESWFSSVGALRFAVAAALGWAVLSTSVATLRAASVAPSVHLNELRSIEPQLGQSKTLYLGWSEFVPWELSGTPLGMPALGAVPLTPRKHWSLGEPLEFEDIPASVLDEYDYVIQPRNYADSEPPSNMKLVRTTRFFEVWRRLGPTPPWRPLASDAQPGAVLDCSQPSDEQLSKKEGFAIVRQPNIEVAVPPQSPGTTVEAQIELSPGSWTLSTPYFSPHPVEVSTEGLHVELPANLERPGNQWLIGDLLVKEPKRFTVRFHAQDTVFASNAAPTEMTTLIATREHARRKLALHKACGQYVEWYAVDSSRHFPPR